MIMIMTRSNMKVRFDSQIGNSVLHCKEIIEEKSTSCCAPTSRPLSFPMYDPHRVLNVSNPHCNLGKNEQKYITISHNSNPNVDPFAVLTCCTVGLR